MSVTKLWRVGIECKIKQIWVIFYQCEECACMLYEIWLRAYFSRSVRYWYEICDILVPILHVLWGFGNNSSQCKIYEVWNLRFNNGAITLILAFGIDPFPIIGFYLYHVISADQSNKWTTYGIWRCYHLLLILHAFHLYSLRLKHQTKGKWHLYVP